MKYRYQGNHVRVRNLDRYQHYRDRHPPWVKLHNAILDDLDFATLPDTAKYHALGILLLASRSANHVPAVPSWIKQRLSASSTVDLQALISSGWLEWCECENCSGQQPEKPARKRKQIPNEVLDVWQAHLDARAHYYQMQRGRKPPTQPDLTPELASMIRQAISRHGKKKAKAAGVGIFLSDFHTGDNDQKREYLQPELCWRIKKGTQSSNTERFAELALEIQA